MKEHEVNQQNNFICGYYTDNLPICDEIIKCHQENPVKWRGHFAHKSIDPARKEDTESEFNNQELVDRYWETCLQPALVQYKMKHISLDSRNPFSITEMLKLQHYAPGEGYHVWHDERMGPPNHLRLLAFMTYLNDVEEGGETEFMYQQIKVKPEKGLTLIWPVDWTHTHRGLVAPKEDKYIVTGWFNYENFSI
jgi:prolyl 4-hydroxylase